MRAVIDANVLMQVMGDCENGLICPITGEEISDLQNRTEALVQYFSDDAHMILIPAPVLAEILVRYEESTHQDVLNAIKSSPALQVAPFNEICAVECARILSKAEIKQWQAAGDAKAKISVDRQVIATGIAYGADELWTHDDRVFKKVDSLAGETGMIARSLSEVDPQPKQHSIFDEAVGGDPMLGNSLEDSAPRKSTRDIRPE